MSNHLLFARLALGGLKSRLPWTQRERGTGGTIGSRYCYSVWMRHRMMLAQHMPQLAIEKVVEMGPGDSLGTGLAALLTGVQSYSGLDVVQHTDARRNVAIFDQLVAMVRARASVPDADEFPSLKPPLLDKDHPARTMSAQDVAGYTDPARIDTLRRRLRDLDDDPSSAVRYICPWGQPGPGDKHKADLLFSQAVMEYMDDLDGAYQALAAWIRPGGAMSHQIDLSCHGLATTWDGHWAYTDLGWKMIRGKRPFFINRAPASAHFKAMERAGMEVVHVTRFEAKPTGHKLAPRFATMSADDRNTRGIYVIARKY